MLGMLMLAYFFIFASHCFSANPSSRRGVDQSARLPEQADNIDFGKILPIGPGNPFGGPASERKLRLTDGEIITEETMGEEFNSLFPNQVGYSYDWVHGNARRSTVAQGTDRRYHFANSFLVNFVPFRNVSAWVPLAALSHNKKYQEDFPQYGVQDLWQTSQEAFYYPTGDCEDHAIAAADWLIGLGYDARVVLGKVGEQGHAWVVILYQGDTFLIEATDKQTAGQFTIPLAASFPEYLPDAMFNRESYWINTGNRFGGNYQNKEWFKTSSYLVGKQD